MVCRMKTNLVTNAALCVENLIFELHSLKLNLLKRDILTDCNIQLYYSSLPVGVSLIVIPGSMSRMLCRLQNTFEGNVNGLAIIIYLIDVMNTKYLTHAVVICDKYYNNAIGRDLGYS